MISPEDNGAESETVTSICSFFSSSSFYVKGRVRRAQRNGTIASEKDRGDVRIEVGGWEGGSGAQTGLFSPPSPSLHEVDVAQPVLFSFSFYVIS